MELQAGVLSTFEEWHPDDVTLKSVRRLNCNGNIFMTSLVQEQGRQCIPCSAKFSMTLQTEVLSTETSDFLTQIIFLKSFDSVLLVSYTCNKTVMEICPCFYIFLHFRFNQ